MPQPSSSTWALISPTETMKCAWSSQAHGHHPSETPRKEAEERMGDVDELKKLSGLLSTGSHRVGHD